MTEILTLAGLADRLLVDCGHAGASSRWPARPGSGKSTAAEHLLALLDAARPGRADIVPMDGFHLDDRVLDARGDRARKGAPHTFDIDGFQTMLERLCRDEGRDIAVPLFDRAIETARAGARIIAATTRIVLVEGNYLLLDAPGWRDLASLFHVTVMIDAPEASLVERLHRRWRELGYDDAALAAKMEGNDLPNMRLVLDRSRAANVVVRSEVNSAQDRSR